MSEFLDCIAQARERQIVRLAGSEQAMIFYCWFDEQASQLRFSLVSTLHNRLTFGATLKETDDFARVVNLFLSSHYHDSISLKEFKTEKEFDKLNFPGPPPSVLLVATKILPAKIDAN